MWHELIALVLTVLVKLSRVILYSKRMHLRPWRPQASRSPSGAPTTAGPCLHPPRQKLTESQRRMYKLEKEENFRWIARLLSSSSTHVLTHADLLPAEKQSEIADIGQYAEVAHGSVDPSFIWRNLGRLVRPTFPLEGYDALLGSELVCAFRGEVARLQGYIAHRPDMRQLVVAFSGTSSPVQALHDVDARMVRYPILGKTEGIESTGCKVHAGFWRMFQGLRRISFANLADALRLSSIEELVITGHSLGAVQAYLFLIELLQCTAQPSNTNVHLSPGMTIKLVGFGGPRVGNEVLAIFYRKLVSDYQQKHGQDALQEYSVKGYNDGVPCLPPKAIGFRHLTASPYYLFHGRLFRIPPSENEHSVFPVKLDDDGVSLDYPRGGHNYYNNRDMEKSLRCMRYLISLGDASWEEHYPRYRTKMQNPHTT